MHTPTTEQHTPKTWFIAKNHPLHQQDILDDRGDVIARCLNPDNALLIAAAPALLEALKDAEEGLRLKHAEKSWLLRPILAAAQAAIAKAEGRNLKESA